MGQICITLTIEIKYKMCYYLVNKKVLPKLQTVSPELNVFYKK
nr:MAG TPA_asm: hypothetical protein [Caudoviricetes sp.]